MPNERPCQHEHRTLLFQVVGDVVPIAEHCNDCPKWGPKDFWRGWDEAMAAVRARGIEMRNRMDNLGAFSVGGGRDGQYWLAHDGHGTMQETFGMEPGKSYLLVALPVEE